MKQPLLFATNNSHKLREVREMMDHSISILSCEEVGLTADVEETGTTFEENALLKANFFHTLSKMDCFADDSGLEVDSLGGAPGVRSARFAGEPANDAANLQKLLFELGDAANRNARFRCVIALIRSEKCHFFEGIVEGSIAFEPWGQGGFGYDPIFIPKGYSTSFAEMPATLKNQLSHRSQAIRKMVDFLKSVS